MKLSDVIIILLWVLALVISGVCIYGICNADLPTWVKLWLIFRG